MEAGPGRGAGMRSWELGVLGLLHAFVGRAKNFANASCILMVGKVSQLGCACVCACVCMSATAKVSL